MSKTSNKGKKESKKSSDATNVDVKQLHAEEKEEAISTKDDYSPEIEKIKREKEEYIDSLQRLQAEFDNYRKRNESISLKCKEEGIIYVLKKLLVVLDSFDSAKKKSSEKDLVGINLIENQLNKVLEDIGVTKIDAQNQQFDPNLHNAILVENIKDKESGEIIEVLQEGYKYKDNIVRHSVVKINE